MTNDNNSITAAALTEAAGVQTQLETLRPQIATARTTLAQLEADEANLVAKLNDLLPGGAKMATRKRGPLSDEAKARIAAGQKAAWAKRKTAPATPAVPAA